MVVVVVVVSSCGSASGSKSRSTSGVVVGSINSSLLITCPWLTQFTILHNLLNLQLILLIYC